MDRNTGNPRIRRLLAYIHSAEWVGDPGVHRVLAGHVSTTARAVWEGLRSYSRQSLVAGRIPAFLPRGEPRRSAAVRDCCTPVRCA